MHHSPHGTALSALLILLCVTTTSIRGETPALAFAGTPRPELLDEISQLDDTLAVGLDAAGLRGAAAVSIGESNSEILLFGDGASGVANELRGTVRDLLLTPDGATVLGIGHRAARRGGGESFLFQIDFASGKMRRVMRLPPTANSLDHWTARDAVAIACLNEIRTVSLPHLRSGPLFPVPGRNLAMIAIGGSDWALVGQDQALLLLDLSRPPGLDDVPVIQSSGTPAAVVELASAADGRSALGLLADGGLLEIGIDPLSVKLDGTARGLASSSRTQAAEPEWLTARWRPAPTPAPETEPAQEQKQEPLPEPAPTPRTLTETQPAPLPATTLAEGALAGRIRGAAADRVVAVVLFGPDNILREAARVTPDADGNFAVEDLAPGRYRVQLDGGGATVLIAQPPYRLITIGEGSPTAPIEFVVQRAL